MRSQTLAGSGKEKNILSSFTKAYQPVAGHRIREQRVNWETDLSYYIFQSQGYKSYLCVHSVPCN